MEEWPVVYQKEVLRLVIQEDPSAWGFAIPAFGLDGLRATTLEVHHVAVGLGIGTETV